LSIPHTRPVLARLLGPALGLLLQPLHGRLARLLRAGAVRPDALLADRGQLGLPVALALLLLGERVLLVALVVLGVGVGWGGVSGWGVGL
jgi:hypothetical protein